MTDKGKTHPLVLQPKDVPLQTVLIREGRSQGADTRPLARVTIDRAGAHDLAVKRLVAAMARGERPQMPAAARVVLLDGKRLCIQPLEPPVGRRIGTANHPQLRLCASGAGRRLASITRWFRRHDESLVNQLVESDIPTNLRARDVRRVALVQSANL